MPVADRRFLARSGALGAVLIGGELRDLRVLGYRALEGIYVAVRDTCWNTVPGEFRGAWHVPRPGGFTIGWHMRHQGAGIDFDWRGNVEADGDSLSFRMEGTAAAAFEANRIGFCLLHPPELAGATVHITFPDGNTLVTSFPEQISPGPVLTGATSLRYCVGPGAQFSVEITGGLLETEDHRNWADPGWKTYTPPLSEPVPRWMQPGERLCQVLRLRGLPSPSATPAAQEAGPITLDIVAQEGVMPQLGLMLMAGGEKEMATLSRLRPGILHARLQPDRDWRDQLALASACAARLGSALSVALSDADPDWLTECGRALAGLLRPPAAVSVFAPPDGIAAAGAASIVRREIRRGHPGVPVGGGSILHAAELNRAAHLDPDWDFLSFPITAQAHHVSDSLIMATILGQEPAVRCASSLAGSRPVLVGPVSLRPRTTPFTPPDPEDRRDPRESSQFGAAWLCATVIALRTAHMITFLNPLIDGSGVATAEASTDLERLMAALAGLAGQPVLRIDTDRRRIAALAVRRPTGAPLLIAANVSSEPVSIRFGDRIRRLPGYETMIDGEWG